MTPAERERALRIDVERERGRRSLSWFIRHAWHILEPTTTYLHNWHIDLVSGALEALERGDIRKIILNEPPGSMKSIQVSVCFNAWVWIRNPSESFLYTSFDGDLTMRDARKVRKLMTSTWFLERWGRRVRVDPREAVGEFKTWRLDERTGRLVDLGGWRISTSVEGKTTGRHPTIRIIDDSIKPTGVTRDSVEKNNAWYQSTFKSRGNQETVKTIVVQQRVAEGDLPEYLQETEDGWTVIAIPMEYDPETHLSTPWGDDPRTEKGETFFPLKFPQHIVKEIVDTTDPSVHAAQNQQNPVPPGGIIFDPEWMVHRYDALPERGFGLISLDCTFEKTEGSDRVSLQYWWIDKPYFHLVARRTKRMTFTETCDEFAAFCMRWKATGKLVEKKANGAAVIDTFARMIPGIVPVTPVGSKQTRAIATTPLWRAGNVLLPAEGAKDRDGRALDASWVNDYVIEHKRFPKGRNDDDVDSTSQLLAYAGGEAADHFAAAMANARALYNFGHVTVEQADDRAITARRSGEDRDR